MVVLPGTSVIHAMAVAESIRANIQAAGIAHSTQAWPLL